MIDVIRDRLRNDGLAQGQTLVGLHGRERNFVPVRSSDRTGETRPCGRDNSLEALAGRSVSQRFRAWTGWSGRRYVFSVFRGDATAEWLGRLPMDAPAVVVAVERRDGDPLVLLWVDQTGPRPEMFFTSHSMRALMAGGRCELHLHLLAATAGERDAVVADLRARCSVRTAT